MLKRLASRLSVDHLGFWCFLFGLCFIVVTAVNLFLGIPSDEWTHEIAVPWYHTYRSTREPEWWAGCWRFTDAATGKPTVVSGTVVVTPR